MALVRPFPADASLQNVMHAYVVDGGPAGSGQDRFGAYPAFSAEDPDDCSIPANLELRTLPLHNGEAAVSAVGPVTAAR